jgi:hypothetical protein
VTTAFFCLACHTIHGWIDHPHVMKVKGEVGRYTDCSIWRCPRCNMEHRDPASSGFGRGQWIMFSFDDEDPMELLPEFMPFGLVGREFESGLSRQVPKAVARAIEQKRKAASKTYAD